MTKNLHFRESLSQLSWIIAAAVLILNGCEEPAKPWSGPPGAQVVDGTRPFLYGSSAPSSPAPSAPTPSTEPTAIPRPTSRPANLWVSCHTGFRPSSRPIADVTRLGMLCGPANGMTQLGPSAQGTLRQNSPSYQEFEAKAGWCYRVFATVSPEIKRFELQLLSSRGSRLASGISTKHWIATDADRPICTFEDDRFRVALLSAKASGRYAIQIWQLPPRR